MFAAHLEVCAARDRPQMLASAEKRKVRVCPDPNLNVQGLILLAVDRLLRVDLAPFLVGVVVRGKLLRGAVHSDLSGRETSSRLPRRE